jgi:NAD(P)H-dependent flavin oxidoreductase YrpB (nitropropane dioxygenase family)
VNSRAVARAEDLFHETQPQLQLDPSTYDHVVDVGTSEDATTLRFAEKAIAAGVDGIIAIGAGGGGHSGTLSHLAFIPQVRAMFAGTGVLAGAVSNGAAIRAAEILGADLVYMGTRFIATREASAPDAYKAMIVNADASARSASISRPCQSQAGGGEEGVALPRQ